MMPNASSTMLCFMTTCLFSGLVRGNEPRLLRSHAKGGGERLTVIEGMERESILKEFRFEKSSSSRLSTAREDAWQHEDEGGLLPLVSTRDVSLDDSEEESSWSVRGDTLRTQISTTLPFKE